jgi:uncharacterized protein (DUF433 family)
VGGFAPSSPLLPRPTFRLVDWLVLRYNKFMKLLERITVEPGKCGGQPCIRGKRMRVTDVLDLLSHGASHEEILADYSFLEPEDILAAIAYASRLTDHVVLTSS